MCWKTRWQWLRLLRSETRFANVEVGHDASTRYHDGGGKPASSRQSSIDGAEVGASRTGSLLLVRKRRGWRKSVPLFEAVHWFPVATEDKQKAKDGEKLETLFVMGRESQSLRFLLYLAGLHFSTSEVRDLCKGGVSTFSVLYWLRFDDVRYEYSAINLVACQFPTSNVPVPNAHIFDVSNACIGLVDQYSLSPKE